MCQPRSLSKLGLGIYFELFEPSLYIVPSKCINYPSNVVCQPV